MSIVYALVSRDQQVLCEYTEQTGNFPTVTRVVLQQIAQKTEARGVERYDDAFNFVFLRHDTLTFVCLAESQVHVDVALMMLKEVQNEFLSQYEEQAKTARAFSLKDFDSTLASLMKKYDNYKIDTRLAQVRQHTENIKRIMIENVNQLMQRGEKIDLLVVRTDKLQQDAFKYKDEATKLKNVYWWKNMKYAVILSVLVCLLAVFLTFWVCGTDLSSCGSRLQDSASSSVKKQLDSLRNGIPGGITPPATVTTGNGTSS